MIARLNSFFIQFQSIYSLLFLVIGLGIIWHLAAQENNLECSLENCDDNCEGCDSSPQSSGPSSSLTTPQPLTLKEAIVKNLVQQPAIKASLYNIDIQKGIAQSSAAPFDPVVNSQLLHTYSQDLINVNSLINTLQNFPGAGIITPGAANVLPNVNQQNPNQTTTTICSCPSEGCGNVNTNQSVCPPPIHTHQQAHETTVHLDVKQKFREGTRLVFNVDIDQYKNPILCPRRLNLGKVSFEINQPLLRDLHHGLDRMNEIANQQEIEAVRYDTLQVISQQVFNTVSLYWDTLSYRRILQAQIESEERLNHIVDSVKLLIQRGQLAPTDLLQPIAQLSSQIVARVGAEQDYYQAQQQLKFAIGEWNEHCPCPPKEFEVIDDFPTTDLDPYSFPSLFCHLFPAVFQWRFDIMASVVREEKYITLLKGAKNFELPQLDVIGRASFIDFTDCDKSENLFSSLQFEQPQRDFTVGVIFSTPFYRDEAKGLIRQRQGEWSRAQANTQLLKQQALADISAALKDQINLQSEVRKAKEAVEEYQQLIINERKKLIAGYSSIFFLLSFESSLTSAMVAHIHLQDLLAKNIARIRFLTGTLIQFLPFKNTRSFVVGNAVTLPFNADHPNNQEEGNNCHEG